MDLLKHPTVAVCLDADRLQLPRVGITVDPRRLSTTTARERHFSSWAEDLRFDPPSWDEVLAGAAAPGLRPAPPGG